MIYLYLQSSELAVERVCERVIIGGHNIPEDVIHRRYKKGLQNFFKIYQTIPDSWRVYDVSYNKPIHVAFGDKNEVRIFESRLWKEIQN